MKNNQNNHHHITISLAYSGTLLMLLLFSVCFLSPPEVNAAAITCSSGVSGCHFNTTVKDGTGRNVPSGRFTGSHVRHSGYSTGVKRQYLYACTRCHPSSGYTNSHQTGFKNITGSSLPGNRYSAGKKIANTNSPSFGNCSNIYCHSSGRASGMGQVQYSSVRWGGTKTCLGCHGGRNGSNNPARSVGNFTLTTTHSQHLKYPFGDINCQICHSKTATNATTLKNFTGVQRHANGVRDVTFTGVSYGSYTSYKTSGVDIGKCTNISCHGGKTRSVWSATAQNNNHTCTHCHGTASGIGTSNTNRNFYAPGYNSGTSTDGLSNSNDVRVGAHFVHLTSVYMKKLKCNECHYVPSNPFDASNNHMTGPRFSSQSLYFAQSSTAKILIGVASGSTPAQLATFTGYTSGTSAKAATCSSVYCHGNRLKNNITSGTARKPSWDQNTLTATPATATSCGRCHGFPPTDGALHTAGDTVCSSCHSHLSTGTNPTTFVNKALHINGRVEASGSSCVGCHAIAQTGTHGTPRAAVVGEFTLAWGHKKSGRGAVTDADCIVCHLEGVFATQAPSATYHKDGNIDLRDPDTNGEVAITNNSGGAFTFTRFSLDLTTARTSAITNSVADVITQKFCLKCHDAGGATNTSARSGTSPNATNPFGTGKLAINNAAQFATSNSSKHPVLGPLSRDYPAATRMAVPYKPTGTRGTSGTKTAGVVMNCFDCHNAPTTPLTTRTVSAHGNANTIRGTIGVASPTLCAICHLGYTASNTVGHNSGSLTSGSAYSSAENRMQTEQDTCNNCHASAVSPARPARAEDVHGVNTVPAGGTTKTGRWLTGGANGVPIAFIRNTTNLGNHQPKQVNGQNYTVGCDMSPCRSTSGVSPYTPGGTY